VKPIQPKRPARKTTSSAQVLGNISGAMGRGSIREDCEEQAIQCRPSKAGQGELLI